jgi:uncharacterized membrane protein YbhN (UPF0104 family)
MNANQVKLIFKVSVSIGLLFVLFLRFDFSTVFAHLETMRWRSLLIPVFVNFIANFVNALKWKALLPPSNAPSLGKLYQYNLVGYFVNNFLPTGIGGDSYKIVAIHKRGTMDGFGSVALNRITGFIALYFIFLVSGALCYRNLNVLTACFFVFFNLGIFILCFVVLIFRRVIVRAAMRYDYLHDVIGRLKGYLDEVPFGLRRILFIAACSFVVQLLLVSNVMVFFYVVHVSISFFEAGFIFSFISFCMLIPVTLNGWGISENLYLYISSEVFLLQVHPILAFVPRIPQFVVSVLCGFYYLILSLKRGGVTRPSQSQTERASAWPQDGLSRKGTFLPKGEEGLN